MTRHVGVDLGGTNIKVAVLETGPTGSTSVVARAARPTRADAGPEVVASRMVEATLAAIAEHGPIATIGAGVPGLFDPASGAIRLFPNLPGPWPGFPLRDRLEAGIGRPVTVVNDARAFVLAEARLGAARGCRTVAGVTLGTGIGGGLIVDGRLHLGATGTAGEIGHQTVDPDGPRCGCGNRGCVEVLAQAATIARNGGRATAEEVFAAAATGDERAVAAVDGAIRALAIGIANVVTVLVPDAIVIGGGMAGARELILEPLRMAVAARTPFVPSPGPRLVAAELGMEAGAVGAALAGADADADAASASGEGAGQ